MPGGHFQKRRTVPERVKGEGHFPGRAHAERGDAEKKQLTGLFWPVKLGASEGGVRLVLRAGVRQDEGQMGRAGRAGGLAWGTGATLNDPSFISGLLFSEVTGQAGTRGPPVDTCSGLTPPPCPVCFLHGAQGLGPLVSLLSPQAVGRSQAQGVPT